MTEACHQPLRKISHEEAKAFALKMREKVAAALGGHRPLVVLCDICNKSVYVPMKQLGRAGAIDLLASIGIKVGGKESVHALRELVDQAIVGGSLKDFSKARLKKRWKRHPEHYICAGWGEESCDRKAPWRALSPKNRKARNDEPWRCRPHAAYKAHSGLTSEQRSEAARKRKLTITRAQRSEIGRKRRARYVATTTPEQRSEAARKGHETRRKKKEKSE